MRRMKENAVHFYFLIKIGFLDTRSYLLPTNENAHLTTHDQSKFVWCHNRVDILSSLHTYWAMRERVLRQDKTSCNESNQTNNKKIRIYILVSNATDGLAACFFRLFRRWYWLILPVFTFSRLDEFCPVNFHHNIHCGSAGECLVRSFYRRWRDTSKWMGWSNAPKTRGS